MVFPVPDSDDEFKKVQKVATDECFHVSERLFSKFKEIFPDAIVSQSVAAAIGIITHTLLAASYQMLRKGVDKETAWGWLESSMKDVQKVLDLNEVDFQFTLKRKDD